MSGSQHAQPLLREMDGVNFTFPSFSKVWFQLTFCFRTLGGLVPVDILFQDFRKFWNFWVKIIDQLNPFTCNSKGLTNFCIFFGKVIDQLNHFTCKSMEIHILI